MKIISRWLVMGLLATAGATALAQQPGVAAGGAGKAPQQSPQPQDLEPGVNTSATPPANETAPPPAKESAAAPQAQANKPAAPRSGRGQTEVPAPKGGAASAKAHDRIELDTTQITGNRELPKVLYIVPWKRSDLGDLVGKPVNSLLDEVLAPVDRDVFKRQNRYYDALQPDAARQAGAAPTDGQGAAGGKP